MPAIAPPVTGRSEVIRRLTAAGNAHDLDSLAGCFTPDVDSRTPAHPSRNFAGRDQVRRNWGAIFDAVPDIVLSVVGEVEGPGGVWCEYAFDGTRRDGTPHRMRGVVIFGVRDDGLIESVRFFIEPLVDDGAGPDASLRKALSGAAADRDAESEATR